MAKKIPIDRLAAEINKILTEYGNEVQENVDDAARRVTKAGAKAVRGNAQSTFRVGNGEKNYAKGWTSKFETGRLSAQGIIYNKDLPGLPHLLEHGHANRNGGRTPVPGRPHIAPVEQKIIEDFEKAVKKAI